MNGKRNAVRRSGIIKIACGAIGAALLIAPAAASATPFAYGFDADNQGWEITQNDGNANTFTWTDGSVNPLGNPGGFIFDNDSVVENGCASPGGCVMEFLSPGVAPGSLAGNYGGTIAFDLKTTPNLAVTDPARLIVSPPGAGSDALIRDVPVTASTAAVPWTRYTTPLTEAGWFYCPPGSTDCFTATQAQFQSVLSRSVFTDIIADLVRPGATEIVGLDNPSATDPPPVPVVPKKKKCKKKKGHKRSAAGAKKKCKKKKKKGRSLVAPAISAPAGAAHISRSLTPVG
jgi:hypothetical protein